MKLPATLTLPQAAAALRALQAEPGSGRIDASALQDFDSSALALLLHAKRLAQAAGRDFAVQAPPPKLTQLAQLYGVAALLGLDAHGAA